jgi:antitoxin Phd
MPKVKNSSRSRPRSGTQKALVWQLQTAKARFSELFRLAHTDGPQYVSRQGKDTVVVVRADDFERFKARSRQPDDLVRFFAESPLAQAELHFERSRDYGRKVEL